MYDDCVVDLLLILYLCNLCLAKRGFKITHYVYECSYNNQMSERVREGEIYNTHTISLSTFMQLDFHLRPNEREVYVAMSDFPKTKVLPCFFVFFFFSSPAFTHMLSTSSSSLINYLHLYVIGISGSKTNILKFGIFSVF